MTPQLASHGSTASKSTARKLWRWVALAPLAVLGSCSQYDLGDIFDGIHRGGHGHGGGHDVCIVDGERHRPGEAFPSSDGCNTCTCGDDGLVACTERACIPTCETDADCPVPPCACLDENGDGICENTCPVPVCRDGVCDLRNPGALQIGEACGGFRIPGTGECDAGLFCQHQPGALCGAADAPGECVAIPDVCADIFDPVCGCDGVTYGNACEAAANLTGILDRGPCEEEPRCPESCPVILICRICDDGSCADPVVSCNPDGSCGDVSFVCPDQEYEPCAGKQDGDSCTVCDPKDRDCVETAVVKECRYGECVPATGGSCSGQSESCANGESCCGGLTCCQGIPIPRGREFCGVVCPISDRNMKQDIEPIDKHAILERVTQLPISAWSYQAEPDRRHIGPMAQDFMATFEVGSSDRTILQVDADGVALAAIQALSERLERLEKENRALQERLQQSDGLSCVAPEPASAPME